MTLQYEVLLKQSLTSEMDQKSINTELFIQYCKLNIYKKFTDINFMYQMFKMATINFQLSILKDNE